MYFGGVVPEKLPRAIFLTSPQCWKSFRHGTSNIEPAKTKCTALNLTVSNLEFCEPDVSPAGKTTGEQTKMKMRQLVCTIAGILALAGLNGCKTDEHRSGELAMDEWPRR